MGRRDKDPVPGSGTDEDYLRRTGMTRAEYLEYMRNANRRRNERETREFREGKRRFQDAEAERERERGRTYLGFLRKYGNAEERAEGQTRQTPEPGRVRRWWEGRGQHDRWVGQDTPPGGEPAQPPARPRRTGTSLGDLIGLPDREPTRAEIDQRREQRRQERLERRRRNPLNPENWGTQRDDLADESDRNRAVRERREREERWRRNDPTNPENWGQRDKGKGGKKPPPGGSLGIFGPATPPQKGGDDDDNGGGLGIFKKA